MPGLEEGLSVRRHFLIAGVLFCAEILLGIGLIGGVSIVIIPVVLFSAVGNKPNLLKRLQLASVYACLLTSLLALLAFNWRLAERRAAPVVAACKQYHVKYGRYPRMLNDLVPALLPSIPNARYTLIGRKFGYDAGRPSLYFAAMFHGVVEYDFQTDSWRTND